MAGVKHFHNAPKPAEHICEHLVEKHGYDPRLIATPYEEQAALVAEHRRLHKDGATHD